MKGNIGRTLARMLRVFIALPMCLAMGVLTADRVTAVKDPGLQSFLVGTDIIYKGSLVTIDATGYALAGQDASGHKLGGVAVENVDNSAGSPGAASVRLWTEGVFLFAATSITQAMVGKMMYVVDDQTFDDDSTNKVPAGILVEYVSATSGWIDVGPAVGYAASDEVKAITLNGVNYSTISAAMAAAAAGDIIFLGPGTYTEDVTWSDASGVTLLAKYPGTVTVEAVTAFAISINPAAASGTWSATIQGLTISHGDGLVGLLVNNTSVGKRINVYINDCDIESETVTDAAIDVNRGGTSAHAIRMYIKGRNNTIEGLVDFITESTDDRLRFFGMRLIGGVTVTGNIVMEVAYMCTGIKTSGESYGTGNVSGHFACWNETDANPNVYTVVADDDETSH
jgi:hypothetical protein